VKKGQTAVFIIVGIIILVSIGTFFYINKVVREGGLESERERALLVPKQVEPVKIFIEACLDQVSREGIDLIGLQGGYSNMPGDVFAGASQNIFSNSLQIFRNLKVPYWYYEKASGIQESQKPSKDNVEEELNDYINENLAGCVSGIGVFEPQGYEFTFGEVDAESTIKTDSVDLEVVYPINVKFKDIDFNFDKFNKYLDAPLGRLYDLAERIMDSEEKTNFLEEKTLDFLIIYDEIPFDSVDFECVPRVWNVQNVEKDLKNILSLNMPNIKIENSANSFEGDRKYFNWDLGRDYRTMSTNFMFSGEWPFFMNVEPNEDGVLSGTSISGNIKDSFVKFGTSFFCMNNYHFVYDIKYPLLVILRDDNAFGGEGYTFQFAIQIIIDNNQPKKNVFGKVIELKDDLNLCSNKITPVTVESLQVNPDETLSPLEDVDIEFKCLTSTCDIGKTSRDEFGGSSLFSDFPSCLNGFVVGKKEGFKEDKVQLSTNQPSSTSLILEPIYKKPYEVKVIDTDRGVRDPFESEKIVISFDTQDYSTTAIYPSESNEIQLVDGVYNVLGYITRESEQGITLKGTTLRKCFKVPQKNIFGIFGATKEECTDVEVGDTILNNVLVGGAEFEWIPSRFDLSQDNKLILYVYYNGFPSTSEDVFDIYQKISSNKDKPAFSKPQFRLK